MRSPSRLLLFVFALWIGAALGVLPALAQGPVVKGSLRPLPRGAERPRENRYVPFDIPADAQARFQEQFKDAEQFEQFRKMMDKILGDPDLKIDPELFKGVNFKDPELHKKLQGWVDKNGGGKQPAPEDVKKLQEILKSRPPVGEPPEVPAVSMPSP